MKNHIILWVIIIILILVVGSLTVFLFTTNNQLYNVRLASASFEQDIASLESELDLSQQNFNNSTNELTSCKSHLSTAEQNIQDTEQELLDLNLTSQDTIENLEGQLQLSRDQVATKSTKLRELEDIEEEYNQLICDSDNNGQLNMDYSSIQSSSSRLQGFVANLHDTDHVSYAVRNTLWNNADSKIHGITYVSDDGTTYSRQFLVYVDELGWEEGTFYIDGQCWLDSPW